MQTPPCKYFKENLTDSFVRAIRTRTEDMQISDTKLSGLQLRYSCTTQKKVFYFRYTIKELDKSRSLRIGNYGDFSIKEIRRRALKYRQMVSDGIDPMQEKIDKLKKIAEEQKNSRLVNELLDEYLEKYGKIYKKPSTWKSDQRMIEKVLKPFFEKVSISDLDLAKLTDLYDTGAKNTSFSTANHYIALMSHFWNWCERYKYLPLNSNPCKLIKKKKNQPIDYQLLDMDGYKALLNALEAGINGASNYTVRAFRAIKVIALTGCRHSEITELKKSELDLENNQLKLEDSKTGPKDVPLGDAAVNEIKKALLEGNERSPYVFPATRGEGAIIDLRKAFIWTLNRAGLPHMRIHDLRHSFASLAKELGEDIYAIKEVLGHKYTTTTEIYTHTRSGQKLATANKVSKQITLQLAGE